MPRAAQETSATDVKPYIRSSPPTTPTTKTSATKIRTPTKGQPWTAEDKVAIFNVAIKQGATSKNFEAVLPGRTGKQCYDTWKSVFALLTRFTTLR